MQINNINPISFNGVWAPVKVLRHEEGIYHKNKQVYTLFDMVYHPWIDETKEAIQEAVDKNFFGRNFRVMDIGAEDSHFKEISYQMNRVKVGEPVRHEDEAKLLEQGYTKNVVVGTPSDERFRELFPNYSYAAYDIEKMGPERINRLADSIHWETKA